MLKELSNSEIISLLGQRFKRYRLNLRYTQKELADRTGISVPTIQKFEAGNANNITAGNLMTLLRSVGLIENIDVLIPEQPESPYARKNITKVRHGNQEK